MGAGFCGDCIDMMMMTILVVGSGGGGGVMRRKVLTVHTLLEDR